MAEIGTLPRTGPAEQADTAKAKIDLLDEKRDLEVASEASVLPSTGPAHGNYEASNDEEKALDRRINLKIDVFITVLLGINFMMTGIDKSTLCANSLYKP